MSPVTNPLAITAAPTGTPTAKSFGSLAKYSNPEGMCAPYSINPGGACTTPPPNRASSLVTGVFHINSRTFGCVYFSVHTSLPRSTRSRNSRAKPIPCL